MTKIRCLAQATNKTHPLSVIALTVMARRILRITLPPCLIIVVHRYGIRDRTVAAMFLRFLNCKESALLISGALIAIEYSLF